MQESPKRNRVASTSASRASDNTRDWLTRALSEVQVQLRQTSPGSELHAAYLLAERLARGWLAMLPGHIGRPTTLEKIVGVPPDPVMVQIVALLSEFQAKNIPLRRSAELEEKRAAKRQVKKTFLRIIESYRGELQAQGKPVTDLAAIKLMVAGRGISQFRSRNLVPRIAKKVSAIRQELGQPALAPKSAKTLRK